MFYFFMVGNTFPSLGLAKVFSGKGGGCFYKANKSVTDHALVKYLICCSATYNPSDVIPDREGPRSVA